MQAGAARSAWRQSGARFARSRWGQGITATSVVAGAGFFSFGSSKKEDDKARPEEFGKKPPSTAHKLADTAYGHANLEEQSEGMKLRQIVVVMRHGDRTPLSTSFGTKYDIPAKEIEYWTESLPKPQEIEQLDRLYPVKAPQPLDKRRHPYAMLTQRGAKEAYELGLHLRSRYDELIGDALAEQSIYVRSTNYVRTRQTAQNFLKGLVPSGTVSIKCNKDDEENLYPHAGPTPCPRQKEIIKEVSKRMADEDAKKDADDDDFQGCSTKQLNELNKRIAEIYEADESKPISLTAVMDVLKCRRAHNMGALEGLDKDTEKLVEQCQIRSWNTWYESEELNRLAIGRAIGDIYKIMEGRTNGKNSTRVAVYSAHDSTILPILGAFNVHDKQWPPYVANIVLELYENKKGAKKGGSDFYVRMLYNGKSVKLPGCEKTVCSFSNFEKAAKKVIPKDYEKECQAQNAPTAESAPKGSKGVGV